MTVTDRASRGEREDLSGPALADAARERGHDVGHVTVVPDEREEVSHAIRTAAESADLVLTTGGTGLAPRDCTPEATAGLLEREIPGLVEEIRRRSIAQDPRGALSRGRAGMMAGGCLVLNLPGSPRGAVEAFGWIHDSLPHASKVARGGVADCAQEGFGGDGAP
ncbi:MAG: MogA/MoaB family molybdenum cofactor biosynthesis protein [Planctomycetota bacterium]